MKKIVLFTLLFFISFVASAQLADNSSSETSSFRSFKRALRVFPNPATEYFQLADKNDLVDQINIYNIVGKKMKTFKVVDDKKYYLNQFPKGMYLVQLVSSKNKVISTQRLNVKKP
ncbi:T9SS type A sorting domain-containing protein [Saprospiraceae bacterium]|jgi:hypothetical protein|nr:T9SS type A sorting domain-containing protein [Saprospiraceae bacterium]MDG1433119.1 T9SS type A sorting domain-containing protein [Saprospiraceae bacterium]